MGSAKPLQEFFNLSDRFVVPKNRDDDPTKAGHHYLAQYLEARDRQRDKVIRLAQDAYPEVGPGCVIWFWDGAFEDWPRRCSTPGCNALHDAQAWLVEFPEELAKGSMFYFPAEHLEADDPFEADLLELIAACDPQRACVVAVLDRPKFKGAMQTLLFEPRGRRRKSSRRHKGFG